MSAGDGLETATLVTVASSNQGSDTESVSITAVIHNPQVKVLFLKYYLLY